MKHFAAQLNNSSEFPLKNLETSGEESNVNDIQGDATPSDAHERSEDESISRE